MGNLKPRRYLTAFLLYAFIAIIPLMIILEMIYDCLMSYFKKIRFNASLLLWITK